jgi:hypothetical protein
MSVVESIEELDELLEAGDDADDRRRIGKPNNERGARLGFGTHAAAATNGRAVRCRA